MRRSSRRRRLALGVLLIAGIFLALHHALKPATLEGMIVRRVAGMTGLTLVFDRPLEVDWGLKVRVRAGPVRLMPPSEPTAKPVLEVREIKTAVTVFSLLRGEPELDTLALTHPVLRLTRGSDGTRGEGQGAAEVVSDLAQILGVLALGGVRVEGGELSWRDEAHAREVTLGDLEIEAAALGYAEPVPFSLQARMTAQRPALSGPVQITGTARYDPVRQRYTLAPLQFGAQLVGPTLPAGRATLTGKLEARVESARDRLTVKSLSLSGLAHALSGTLSIQGRGVTRAYAGNLKLVGRDAAALIRALEWPGAPELAALGDRSSDFSVRFEAIPAAGRWALSTLRGRFVGTRLDGHLEVLREDGRVSTAAGDFNLVGADLPGLIRVAHALMYAEAPRPAPLEAALDHSPSRRFEWHSRFEFDAKRHRLSLPAFTARGLGATLTAQLADLPNDARLRKGEAHLEARDPAALAVTIAALRGASPAGLDALMHAFGKAPSRPLSLQVAMNVDEAAAELMRSRWEGRWHEHALRATTRRTDAGGQTGKVQVTGPDLAALMGLVAPMVRPLDPLARLSGLLAASAERAYAMKLAGELDPAGMRVALRELNLKAYGLNATGAFKVDPRAAEGSFQLRGRALGPVRSVLRAAGVPLPLTGIALRAAANGPPDRLGFQTLEGTGELGEEGSEAPVTLQLKAGNATADWSRKTFAIDRITITGAGLAARGSVALARSDEGPGWRASLEAPPFNLRKTLTILDLLPPQADAQAFHEAAFTLRAQAHAGARIVQIVHAKVDDTEVKGELMWPSGDAPLQLSLKTGAVDLNRYLGRHPPLTPESLVLLASRVAPARLSHMPLRGTWHCDALRTGGLSLSALAVEFAVSDEALEIGPAHATLYGGRYRGRARLADAASTPQIHLQSTLARVRLGNLLADLGEDRALDGTLNLESDLTLSGGIPERQRRTLAGTASFALTEGALEGIDLPVLAKVASRLLRGKKIAPPDLAGRSPFDSLTASLAIAEGRVQSRDLLMEGPGYRLSGEGLMADLPRLTMDYRARLAVRPDEADTRPVANETSSPSLELHCRGALKLKSCKPDYAALTRAVAQSAARTLGTEAGAKAARGAGAAIRKLLEY